MVMRQLYTPKWQLSVVTPSSAITDVLRAISNAGGMMACVLDSGGQFLGIITDSDVRRHILRGGGLKDGAELALNKNPVIGFQDMSFSMLTAICEEHDVRELPICSKDGRLVDIFVLGHSHPTFAVDGELSNPGLAVSSSVFISAGGKGSRLRSVVSDRPKPLALVGNTPMLETVISQAHREGYYNFYVSVNHMAEMIEEHLAQSKYSHLNIKIVRESEPLGTAGAIGFVAHEVDEPLLVTNADVLTTVPYRRIMRSHLKTNAWMTCVARPHDYTVPFGVVDIKNDLITGIQEKPTCRWMTNSGIYILSPEACRMVKKDERLDMPELIKIGLKLGKKINPFILHEYWVDVGRPDDYNQANQEFSEHFRT